MITINKKIYEELKPYAIYMRQAYYSCCVMNISALKITQLVEIAKKAGYNNSVNPSCSSCVIKMLSALGKEYFAYEKVLNESKKNKKKPVVIDETLILTTEEGEE